MACVLRLASRRSKKVGAVGSAVVDLTLRKAPVSVSDASVVTLHSVIAAASIGGATFKFTEPQAARL